MSTREAIAAVNRFGLGAMPGEIAAASDARGWLAAQLRGGDASEAFAGLPSSAEILRRETAFLLQRRARAAQDGAPKGAEPQDAVPRDGTQRDPASSSPASRAAAPESDEAPTRRALNRGHLADVAARYRHAASTDRSFVERMVRFWSNHFAVSVDKGVARLYAAPMEREAIRPHVLGNFADMLVAVESHPAMLRYLDNAASVGDASPRALNAQRRRARRPDAKPARKLGINENLAREIMELHTLGVDGGYAQADVAELARAITGWSVPYGRGMRAAAADAAGDATGFVFVASAHEPGSRKVLGATYAEGGVEQGRAILRALAVHPATARHLSAKLARHVVQDRPDDALVRRMARAYLDSGGELTALYRALILDDAAWGADARKYKTPDDFLVSAMRAGGFALDRRPNELVGLLRDLGQPVFNPRSPEGYPDAFGDWAGGDALYKRLQVAGTLAARVEGAAPLELAQSALGNETVQGDFAAALRRAGSPHEGYALLFSSPAFQWR